MTHTWHLIESEIGDYFDFKLTPPGAVRRTVCRGIRKLRRYPRQSGRAEFHTFDSIIDSYGSIPLPAGRCP